MKLIFLMKMLATDSIKYNVKFVASVLNENIINFIKRRIFGRVSFMFNLPK